MTGLRQTIDAAVSSIRKKSALKPDFAIVLGTGLSGLAKSIKSPCKIPYSAIQGFPESTLDWHKGDLLLGKLEGRNVVAMEGRFHLYEGYSCEQITFPIRVMRALGAKMLVVSNAAGGLNPLYRKGDLVLIDDHINLMGVNPLIGRNDDSMGPRFPDMIEPYDRRLLDLAEHVALEEGIRAHRGVYAAMTGPSLETRAEYRMLRTIGADCIGMSTVPEVIVAVHSGMRTLGFSIVTDLCLPDALQPVNIKEIIDTANAAEPRMTRIIRRVVAEAK
jgi:purine-nucleoside phosphorylase